MFTLAGYILLTLRFKIYTICLLKRSQIIMLALYFYIYYLISRRCTSTSSAALDVALYTLYIALTTLACILYRMLSVFFVYILPLTLVFNQIEQAYIIYSSAMALYSLRISISVIPHVEPLRQLSALTVFIALYLVSSIYSFYYSFESIVRPRYLHVSLGVILPQLVCTILLLLIRMRKRIK